MISTRKYVIARFNEDVSWLETLPANEVVIYNKGELLNNAYFANNIRNVPNIGRDSHTHLYYITANYNNLPDIIIFSQGYIIDHIPEQYGTTPAKYLELLGDSAQVSENGLSKNFCETRVALDFNIQDATKLMEKWNVKDPTSISFGEWFLNHFKYEFPFEKCFVAWGSIFAMRKEQILTRPKEFYQNLLMEHGYLNAPIECHFLERAWFYIPQHKLSQIHFYSICLKNRIDRVEKVNDVKNILPQMDIVTAFDASKFSESFIEKLKEDNFFAKRNGKYEDFYRRPYHYSVIGCWLSHKNIIEKIQHQKEEYAVIFEDDIILLPNFHEKMCKVMELVEQYEKKYGDFDIANLYISDPTLKKMFKDTTVPEFMKTPEGYWGTVCYIVKKSTVKKVLNILQQLNNPIDEQLSRSGLKYIFLVGLPLLVTDMIPSFRMSESFSALYVK